MEPAQEPAAEPAPAATTAITAAVTEPEPAPAPSPSEAHLEGLPVSSPRVPDATAAIKAKMDAWKSAAVAEILRNEAAESLTGETAGLSASELRERVLALSAELTRRSKWEAIHLMELADKNEKMWKTQYEEWARAREEEVTTRAASEVEERVEALRQEMAEELHAEVEKEKRRADEESRARYNEALREATSKLFERVGAETEERNNALSALRARVAALNTLLTDRQAYEKASARVHRIELAVLALINASDRPVPLTQEMAALKVAGSGDALIDRAVALMPKEAHGARGIPSVADLQLRYARDVAATARTAAFTPVEGGVVGHALAAASARLVPRSPRSNGTGKEEVPASVVAAPASEESVSGPRSPLSPIAPYVSEAIKTVREATGTADASTPAEVASKVLPAAVVEGAKRGLDNLASIQTAAKEKASEVERVREALDAVEDLVAGGQIERAVDTLTVMRDGLVADVVKDWVRDAQLRVAADRAAKLARARAGVLAATLY